MFGVNLVSFIFGGCNMFDLDVTGILLPDYVVLLLRRLGMADWRRTSNNQWKGITKVSSASYACGYCGNRVASESGWDAVDNYFHRGAVIFTCPECNGPTFFDAYNHQWPGPIEGGVISNLSREVIAVYEEAKRSITASAYTGSVMLCRKLLMHAAVDKGADKDKSFQSYVKWLIDEHYAPRGAESWLTYVKDRGNEANHELVVMSRDDAIGVLRFTEALLRGIYELPNIVPKLPEKK